MQIIEGVLTGILGEHPFLKLSFLLAVAVVLGILAFKLFVFFWNKR